MKSNIENLNYKLPNLSKQELEGIYGGDFFGCDPSSCFIAYASHILIALVKDNIEHPIGAAAGYPPK